MPVNCMRASEARIAAGAENVRPYEGGGVGMGERAADRESEGEGVGEHAGRVSLQKHCSS